MKIAPSKIEMMRREASADPDKIWAAASQTLPRRRRRDAVASVAALLRQRVQRAPLFFANADERGAPQEPASPATVPLPVPRLVPGSDQAARPATGPLRASQPVPEPAPPRLTQPGQRRHLRSTRRPSTCRCPRTRCGWLRS